MAYREVGVRDMQENAFHERWTYLICNVKHYQFNDNYNNDDVLPLLRERPVVPINGCMIWHFGHSFSNFYRGGSKKCEIWPQFSMLDEALWSRNEARYSYGERLYDGSLTTYSNQSAVSLWITLGLPF